MSTVSASAPDDHGATPRTPERDQIMRGARRLDDTIRRSDLPHPEREALLAVLRSLHAAVEALDDHPEDVPWASSPGFRAGVLTSVIDSFHRATASLADPSPH